MKLTWFCNISYSLQIEKRPLVKTAATFFHKLCYERRDEIDAGIICAGWDDREGGQVRHLGFVNFISNLEKRVLWSI